MASRKLVLTPLLFFALLSRALGAAPHPTPSALTGRVVDGAGKPVAGAEVLLGSQIPDRRGDEVEEVFRTRSASDGRFRLETLPHGRLGWLVVRREGFAQTVLGLSLRPLAPVHAVLRRGREVRGSIVDEAGQPIEGVEIEGRMLLDLGSGWVDSLPPELRDGLSLHTRTGADGAFRFVPVSSGGLVLQFRGDGYTPLRAPAREIPVGPGTTPLGRYTLATGDRIEGRVTDREGAPLAGIQILRMGIADELSNHARWREAWRLHPPVLTGADGRFVLAGLPAGSPVTLQICSDRYRSPEELISLYELPAEPLTLVLEPKAPGAAVVARRNLWGDDVEVCPETEDQNAPKRAAPSATTPVSPASTANSALPAGSAVPGPSATLSGRVLVRGRPLAGVLVRAVDIPRAFHETRTGKDGRYRLEGIAPGSLYVGASREEYEQVLATRPPEPVVLQAGENHLDLKLLPAPTPILRGRVLDSSGHPLAGVLLMNAGVVHSRADGTFVLPAERFAYFLVARKPGYPSWAYGGDPTEKLPAWFDIRLERGTTLTGRVAGLSAADLPRVQVEVQRSEGTFAHGLAPDGTFRFEGLPNRRVEITAWAGLRIAKLDLSQIAPGPGGRESSAPVELVFAPLFPLQGRVVDAQGLPVEGAYVEANSELASRGSDRTASRKDGTFTLHLPATRFSIKGKKSGYGEGLRQGVVVGDGSGAAADPAPTAQPVEIRLGPAQP